MDNIINASHHQNKLRIAILGGGPAGLFVFKRLTKQNNTNLDIHIFEKKTQLGAGFPYCEEGAGAEHVTNVSGNEIPELVTTLGEWIQKLPDETLQEYNISKNNFTNYKVLPRLLFGKYLEDQFKQLIQSASAKNFAVHVHLNTEVINIYDDIQSNICCLETSKGETIPFDKIIICSGHYWPKTKENAQHRYFDSPYPPKKLKDLQNCSIAIRGSSLTAIDALKTLARQNGFFTANDNGILKYTVHSHAQDFKITMFSRNGLLPAVRFHLDDPHLSKDDVLSNNDIEKNRLENNGFLSLDYVFETKFKEPIKEKQAWFYEQIKDMNLETFVDHMLSFRESIDAFNLLEAEYIEAEKSIKRKQSVYWKEMLAVLSFVMNYPAKYFSAEDMLRLQNTLMPLISVVIAFVPQSSVEEMLALHKAGVLDLVTAGNESFVEPLQKGGAEYHFTDENGDKKIMPFDAFVDCIGQPHLSWKDIPYKGLINPDIISQARLKFNKQQTGKHLYEQGNKDVMQSDNDGYELKVAGIRINDYFQLINEKGEANDRIFMMAVPYIGGFNPDYSGLDFGEAASAKIAEKIFPNTQSIAN